MKTTSVKLFLIKIILGALIVLELPLVVVPFLGGGISSQKVTRAWYNWYRNPSQQTERILKNEKKWLCLKNAILEIVLLTPFILNTIAILIIWKWIRSGYG